MWLMTAILVFPQIARIPTVTNWELGVWSWEFPDETEPVQATCPVDGTSFKAARLKRTNFWGGTDRDFCRHAFKTFPLEVQVWICPGCGYCGTEAQFSVEGKEPVVFDDAVKRKIREGLKPATALPKKVTQDNVPAWVRFDLMAQSQKLRGASPRETAVAYLYGAWITRQRGVTYLQYFEEFEELYARYGLDKQPLDLWGSKVANRTDYDLGKAGKLVEDIDKGRFRGTNLLLARYLAAYVYRKHGENNEALALYETICEEAEKSNSIVHDALVTMKESIDLEREMQRKALAEFEEAAKDAKLTGAERGDVFYQIGEIHRRLGRADGARDAYKKAIENEGTGEQTKIWAEEQLKLVEGRRP